MVNYHIYSRVKLLHGKLYFSQFIIRIYMTVSVLPSLVIIFDTAMLDKNFGPAKLSALKIIDDIKGKNIVVLKYILIALDEGFIFIYWSLLETFLPKISFDISEYNWLCDFSSVLGLKYQEMSTTNVNSFKLAIQQLVRKNPTGSTKILYVLRQFLKTYSANQIIVLVTDNKPDDSTSISELFTDINFTNIQVRLFT